MGVSVSRIGKTFEETFEAIKEQIMLAPHCLYPDSDVVVMQPSTDTIKVFRVEFEVHFGKIRKLELKEVPQSEARGVAMPLSVAGIYGPKPKDSEWIGVVHLG